MGTPSVGPTGLAREGVSAPYPYPSRPQHGEPETARPDLRPPRRGDKSISGATRPQPAPPWKPRRHRPTSPLPPLHPAPWGPGGAVVTLRPLSPKKQRARGPRRYHPVTPILVWGDGHYSDLGPGKDGVSAGPGESLRQQRWILSQTPPRRQFGSSPGSRHTLAPPRPAVISRNLDPGCASRAERFPEITRAREQRQFTTRGPGITVFLPGLPTAVTLGRKSGTDTGGVGERRSGGAGRGS